MQEAPRRSPKRHLSPITRRILAVNLLALLILVAGLLYLGEYRRSLVVGELASLRTQAEMFAAALGEGAVSADSPTSERLVHHLVRQMVRRLVTTTGARARLFNVNGELVADSRLLVGPGGVVQIMELPPPRADTGFIGAILDIYDHLVRRLTGEGQMHPYRERPMQRAGDYEEAVAAISGNSGGMARSSRAGMILSVAVPVRRYKHVLGALMLSKDSHEIDETVLQVRLDILKVFAVALAVTIALSFYLASTIAKPIHLLADAAEKVRHGHHRQHAIPHMAERNDEIGELAKTLGDMTESLWQRMDAIESFAADVAHEIKNPLTSLRSAVETAARVKNPDQQRQLMSIIKDDVQRLDRLISDISDASRLDAEMSRAEEEAVDLGAMLATLVDMHQATAETAPGAAAPSLRLEHEQAGKLTVYGIESRLAQIFRNLIANALSFTPPDGVITLGATAADGWITVTIDDQGPGIPDGKEEAIFQRFYSERPEGEKFGTHSGLGLSISRQIAQAHGGAITAQTLKNEAGNTTGSRFTVRLPMG